MNRRDFCVAMAGAAAGCRRGPRLNVFNWSSYVAPETVPAFEKETGARVRYAVYESNEEMLAKVMGGNSGWDVVFPSNYLVRPMIELGLLAPLDHRLLGNLKLLEPRFRRPAWDPDLASSVPYMWGATGIAYNRAVTPAPRAWADLWRQDLKGRITMLDDPAEVLGACLKKLGYSINATGRPQLAEARREAIVQKPLLRAYLNAEVRDQLVAGDVLAAQLWATTARQATQEAAQLHFVYPAEGYALYVDTAVILRESSRAELAHRFLDYLLRPGVAAAAAQSSQTATVNAEARRLLPENMRTDPVLYPPPDVLSRGELFEPLQPAAQRLRDRIWTEIKSA
jgi:spermidine/putrescine transport system substrate-binding protein